MLQKEYASQAAFFRWVPSSLSVVNFRVQPLEFNARVPRREAPVDRSGVRIAPRLPGRHLADEGCRGADAPVQTLATQHAELEFRHVQPTAMFGRVMKLQAT